MSPRKGVTQSLSVIHPYRDTPGYSPPCVLEGSELETISGG